ncbi:MAG: amidohydrolase family protein [Chitinophagaceae bacterium]|nr:amidohydrolase family protein [Chitinophagaceae bacterium]
MKFIKHAGKIFFTFLFFIIPFIIQAQHFERSVARYITDSAKIIALVDAKIIDGTGNPSKAHQSIIIINGRIAEVGNATNITLPKDAKVINCSGKTIIPGMVMLHEHLYYTMFMGQYFNLAEMPYSFPRMYLAGGATTIRTAGSIEPQTDLAIKEMISEGKLIGPDIDVTAPYIERKGWDIPSLNLIKDSAEAAATVKFWADKGCTSFKMYVHATREDLIAVVREAHKRKLKVTGHIGTLTYHEAAELGIDDLEHGFFVSSDFDKEKKVNENEFDRATKALLKLPVNSDEMKNLIRYLINKNVAVTSTLAVFAPYTNSEVVPGGGDSALLPEVAKMVTDRWKYYQHKDSDDIALYKKELVWEKQFFDAGGLLVCGTDPTGSGNILAGYGSRKEIELLVEGGFTVVQAIKIATLNGAKYLDRDRMIGSVTAGKNADLVLIDGDLEKDIRDIRKTEIIFKNGTGFNSKKIFDSVKGKVGLN